MLTWVNFSLSSPFSLHILLFRLLSLHQTQLHRPPPHPPPLLLIFTPTSKTPNKSTKIGLESSLSRSWRVRILCFPQTHNTSLSSISFHSTLQIKKLRQFLQTKTLISSSSSLSLTPTVLPPMQPPSSTAPPPSPLPPQHLKTTTKKRTPEWPPKTRKPSTSTTLNSMILTSRFMAGPSSTPSPSSPSSSLPPSSSTLLAGSAHALLHSQPQGLDVATINSDLTPRFVEVNG